MVLTRGAVAARPGDLVTELGAAGAWGLVRSAQSEHPGRFVLVDTDESDVDACWAASWEWTSRRWRCGAARCSSPRLARAALMPIPDGPEWTLTGSLEDLVLAEVAPATLQAGEVRIEVRAAGINFRDVLIALGSYPDAASMGSEAAGVVVEVGAEVTDLAVGDRVFGLVSGGFGRPRGGGSPVVRGDA